MHVCEGCKNGGIAILLVIRDHRDPFNSITIT